MITFHGTQDENLDSIFKFGLRHSRSGSISEWKDIDPIEATDWTDALTGKQFADFVYLSTQPVAGKGGDPVSFAGPWRDRTSWGRNRAKPGCIVIVDCPREFVRKALSNQDVDRFHEKAYIHYQLDARGGSRSLLWIWHYLKTHGLDPTPKLFAEQLELVKDRVYGDYIPTDFPPETWQEFAYAYRELMDAPPRTGLAKRRQRLFLEYGLSIPTHDDSYEWFASPFHIVSDYTYGFRFRGVAESERYEDVPFHFQSSAADRAFERLIVGNLPFLMNAVTGYFEPHSFEEMDAYLKNYGTSRGQGLGSGPWLEKFPPLENRLPPTWRPDFGEIVDEGIMRMEDTQLLCDSVPPEYILGAIKIWDGRRFLPHVRPNRRRGITLESRLWKLTRQLQKSYSGRPVLVEK